MKTRILPPVPIPFINSPKKPLFSLLLFLLFQLHGRADLTLSTVFIAAGNVGQNVNNHLVYILQVDVMLSTSLLQKG